MREEKTKWLVRCICLVLVLGVAAGMHILLPHFFWFYNKCWGLVDIRIHKTPYFI